MFLQAVRLKCASPFAFSAMEMKEISSVSDTVRNPLSRINPVSSVSYRIYSPSTEELQLWLDRHGRRFTSASKIFTDASGVQRYEDSWKAVDIEKLESQSDTFASFGYVSINFQDRKGAAKSVKFLLDWEKLWKYYEEDSTDELAVQAPMLRLFLELFFHERTTQIMFFVCFYDVFLILVLNAAVGRNETHGLVLPEVILICVQLFIYTNMKLLYGGTVFENLTANHRRTDPLTEADNTSNETSNDDDPNQKIASSKHALPFLSTLIQVVKFSCGEAKEICRTRSRTKKMEGNRLHYYNLLNISLKFLTKHNEVRVKDINFNRLSYKLALLFVIVILPIYVIMNYVYGVYYDPTCKMHQSHSKECNYVMYLFTFTLAGLTNFLQYFIFIGSVLVAFVGMAYGGEAAYQLTNSWLNRFSDLRRVRVSESTMEQNSTEESKNSESHITSDTMLKAANESRSVVVTDEEFAAYLSRDAYEQYLLYAEYMQNAGALWSSTVVGLVVYLLYLLAGVTVIVVLPDNQKSFSIMAHAVVYAIVRITVLLIFPVISIAHANSYLYAMHDTFRMSAPGDYAILGGRDKWNAFLEAVPAVWTVFGLWVTWDRMFGMLWALLTAGVAVGITVATSNLSS